VSNTAERGRRADAQRNRDSLLAAASRLFVERGPTVPYVEIAKAAGVGVGTLLDSLPPEQALRTWMDRFIDYMTTKIGMSEAIRAVVSAGGDPFARSRERLDAVLEILVKATTEAKHTRPGINVDDVLMTLSGIAMAAGEPGQREQAGRMVDLLFEGLRNHS
jgi:AcrR family transcriptional regulator